MLVVAASAHASRLPNSHPAAFAASTRHDQRSFLHVMQAAAGGVGKRVAAERGAAAAIVDGVSPLLPAAEAQVRLCVQHLKAYTMCLSTGNRYSDPGVRFRRLWRGMQRRPAVLWQKRCRPSQRLPAHWRLPSSRSTAWARMLQVGCRGSTTCAAAAQCRLVAAAQ